MGVFHLGLLTKDEKVTRRIEKISKEFEFSYKTFASVDEMSEEDIFQFFIIDGSEDADATLSGNVQLVKYYSADSFICVLLNKALDESDTTFIKKSGASILLLKDDLFNSSKVEFLSVQVVKTARIVIKPTDLMVGTEITFDVYHMMPSNKKYLKVIGAGLMLEANKKQNLVKHVNELYVKREDLPKFSEYMNKHQDKSKDGINSRCRSFYLTLQSYFLDLVIMLSEVGSVPTFSQGKELLSNCQNMCSQLLSCLAAADSPWHVVNNSIEGDFGSLERTPGQVATVGIIALNSGFDAVDDIMLATIINNLGLLSMPYEICKKVKDGEENTLSEEDKKLYNNHPLLSINFVLGKKLPLDEKLKSIILNTHQKVSNKKGAIIPEISQLIQLNEQLDRACLTKMGSARKNPITELNKIIDNEIINGDAYSVTLLQRVKKNYAS